jgi:DNA polymerase
MDPALLHARAALDWLLELGADEAIGDEPVNRYALAEARAPKAPPASAPAPLAAPAAASPSDLVARAEALARGAGSLGELAAAMEGFDCELKAGARSFVFADGTAGAPLMVVGEAPGREEDQEGRPFVGAAGRLLDRMLGAIGRDRADPDPARAVYIANVLPWRPPGNRTPSDAEVARWRPFLRRHVELARPRVLLIAGNTPARALLGRAGITRLRGQWQEEPGLPPAMPTFHPSYILHKEADPAEHREARQQVWADLQQVRDRLTQEGP